MRLGFRAVVAAVLCTFAAPPASVSGQIDPARVAVDAPSAPVEVLRSFPHDRHAFTEGLFFHQGRLFESTGEVGASSLREVALDSGKVLRRAVVRPPYFGEGSTDWGDMIVSLTWQDHVAFRWQLRDFKQVGRARYRGEGWGLTHDATGLIMSDGTPVLRFLDPHSFAVRRTLRVTDAGIGVEELNELEYVHGEILANVWQEDRIARIDPATGVVKGWIDCASIVRAMASRDPDAVLNGIAYDARSDRLFVTGKNWPRLFEIRLPH